MANVPETPSFDAGIYQIETTDPVLGGVNGIANAQAKGLANRTAFLKQQIDQLNSGQLKPSWIASTDYVQGELQKLDAKQSVRAATVANITISGAQTIDGVTLTVGDRVLVKDQTTAAQNGIYMVAAQSWTRAADADNGTKLSSGARVAVEEGTFNAGRVWYLATTGPITVGTTALSFIDEHQDKRGLVVFKNQGVSNWTVPAGIFSILVTVVGGGGGGGGAGSNQNYNAAGGGGGAGGYSKKRISVSPGQQFQITVGSGGAGGTSGATVGQPGSTSSFGSECSATGGASGNSSLAQASSTTVGAGGNGGSGVGGEVNGIGGSGYPAVSASPSISSSSVGPGSGGASIISAGGSLGSGGNGGSTAGSNQTVAGQAGSAGCVIIEW